MPIPVLIGELSQTAASNYPAGSDSPATLDDTQRAHGAFIAQLRDGKGFTNPVVLASATTTDIGGQNSQFVEISGTTTITSLGSTYNGPRYLRFQGALTLTHNATSLVIPGAASITTAAGDMCIAIPTSALNGWNISNYTRASGLPAGVAASGANSDITSLTGLTTAISGTALGDKIQPITASVNGTGGAPANGMLITLNPTTLDFRSAALSSGTVNTRKVAAAISLTISSGSTLGTINGQPSRIAVLAIDNAGTVELAAVNIAGGNDLTETGLITTTAEGGAGGADSASGIYSTTARTGVPYRVVGYVESAQSTAGNWASAPTTIQGYGGQAFAAMSSLGYGQTYQSGKTTAVTYYNTGSRPIFVAVGFSPTGAGAMVQINVNGAQVSQQYGPISTNNTVYAIVPPGATYSAIISSGVIALNYFNELR